MRSSYEAKVDGMRETVAALKLQLSPAPPAEAVAAEQIAELQARVERLWAAQLLAADELYRFEDTVADYLELRTLVEPAVVTSEMGAVQPLLQLVTKLTRLSAAMPSDAAFARQLRRKLEDWQREHRPPPPPLPQLSAEQVAR